MIKKTEEKKGGFCGAEQKEYLICLYAGPVFCGVWRADPVAWKKQLLEADLAASDCVAGRGKGRDQGRSGGNALRPRFAFQSEQQPQ